jgi:hypothetical protein
MTAPLPAQDPMPAQDYMLAQAGAWVGLPCLLATKVTGGAELLHNGVSWAGVLSGFSTVGSKFVLIVRRARMVSTGGNVI